MAFRAKRIVEVYGEREQSPEQRLRDKDKRRAAYHRFYTNMKWGYAQNYHITLDSGELGIDKCVLSRSISDGALTFCPIVPWGSSGVFTAAALGVATVQYLPYYFMYLTPIVGILLAAFGLGMYKYDYAADPEGQKIED